MHSPSIAQAGLLLWLWDLEIWAKENNLSQQETNELLQEFGEFHDIELEKDLNRHIGWKHKNRWDYERSYH